MLNNKYAAVGFQYRWIWEMKIKPELKLVMLALFENANPSSYIRLDLGLIADKCWLSKHQTLIYIKELTQLGYITLVNFNGAEYFHYDSERAA